MEQKKDKKEYIIPKMDVVKMEETTNLLSCSGNDDAYWNGCHEGWQGGWGNE